MPGVSDTARRLRRIRAAAARRIVPVPGDSRRDAAASEIVNLAPNPGFRTWGSIKQIDLDGEPAEVRVFDQPFDQGGVYVHVHNVAYAAPVPGHPDTVGVLVRGINDNNDTHIAPGGRNEKGAFRLGLKPGGTYTIAASVYLDRPLSGQLNVSALRICVGIVQNETIKWSFGRSDAARNEFGDHRISVTVTIPIDATAAWVRLISGASAGHGDVYWHSLLVAEAPEAVDYFDGDTPDDALRRYAWTGVPHASPSRMTVRSAAELSGAKTDPAAAVEEALRLACAGRMQQARALLRAAGAKPGSPAGLRVRAIELLSSDDVTPDDVGTARAALRRAAAHGDPRGDIALARGRLEKSRNNWSAAAAHFRRAANALPNDSVRSYELAYVLEKNGQRTESATIARAGVQSERAVPFDPAVLIAVEAKAVGPRREVGIFLAEHLDQIRTQARHRMEAVAAPPLRRPIFLYWGQGFDAAPPIVQRCRASVYASNPGADIHELTDANFLYYVDLPSDLVTALKGNRTHLSDLLRLALLERYGGIWLDATCLVTEPLAPRVDELLATSDSFVFSYAGAFISSWFLAARPDSYLIHLWRAAIFLWWEKRGELIDYFLLHHFFEMLVNLDDQFRAEWEKGVRRSARPPHALQNAMLRPYDRQAYDEMIAGSFVHKLRYKFDPAELRADSYLAWLVRGSL